MATYSSILPWRVPWREEPGGLQSMGSQRVRHNWVTSLWVLELQVKTCGPLFLWRFLRQLCRPHGMIILWKDVPLNQWPRGELEDSWCRSGSVVGAWHTWTHSASWERQVEGWKQPWTEVQGKGFRRSSTPFEPAILGKAQDQLGRHPWTGKCVLKKNSFMLQCWVM